MRKRNRKLVTWLVAPIALVVGVFLIGAPNVSAAGADVFGVGGGSINLGGSMKVAKFAFSGHTGPNGDFGSFRTTVEDPSSPLDIHVNVDCVNVFLNPPGAGGWMSGAVTKVTPHPNTMGIDPGEQLLFGINDFGEPPDPMPDELSASRFVIPPPAGVCKTLGPAVHIPIDQGNIVIKIDSGILPD
jgi:hypothetical protein